MRIAYPTVSLQNILAVTPELLREIGVTALILDVDNTLSLHGSQSPAEGTVEWSWNMRQNGIKMMILSNNTRDRVRPFAAQYGLDFFSRGCKPLPFGYRSAARKMHVERKSVAVVGDQIFTDVLGANLCGMKSILLEPIQKEGSFSFRLRRKMERGIRNRLQQDKVDRERK